MDYREELERRGVHGYMAGTQNYMIECPFHSDTTPSCGVNLASGIFHCFSCDVRGPFPMLIAEIEGISVDAAKQNLTEDESVDRLVGGIEAEAAKLHTKKVVRSINTDQFHHKFPSIEDMPGEQYLRSRRLTLRTLKRFDLRWGLRGEWKDRVIMPVRDYERRIVSFVGRTIHKRAKPKAKTFAGSPRSSVLYGLCEMSKFVRFPYLILVEGEIDCMYLQQFGYFTVASMGSSLSKLQSLLLLRFTSKLILSYDGDVVGREKAQRVLDRMRVFLPIYDVELPVNMDPNSLPPDKIRQIYKPAIKWGRK